MFNEMMSSGTSVNVTQYDELCVQTTLERILVDK